MFLIERHAMMLPSVCFLCEEAPAADSMVIDTLRDMQVKGFGPEGGNLNTHLSGRKYLCTPCSEHIAKIHGWSPPADIETLSNELHERVDELNNLRREAAAAFVLAKAVQNLNPEEDDADEDEHLPSSLDGAEGAA